MILPDCSFCGDSVEIDIDIEGAVEVCTGCGIAQGITHQVLPPHVVREIRRAVRERMRQHRECRTSRCKCYCHAGRAG